MHAAAAVDVVAAAVVGDVAVTLLAVVAVLRVVECDAVVELFANVYCYCCFAGCYLYYYCFGLT